MGSVSSSLLGPLGEETGVEGASSHFSKGETKHVSSGLCSPARDPLPPALPWAWLGLTGLFPSSQIQSSSPQVLNSPHWASGCFSQLPSSFLPVFRQTLRKLPLLCLPNPHMPADLSFGALPSAHLVLVILELGDPRTLYKGLGMWF